MKSDRSVKILGMAGAVSVIAFVVFCALQIPHLNTSYSIRQFFPKEHAALEIEAETTKMFQLQDRPSFYGLIELPASEKGTWLEPARMEKLQALTEELGAVEGVTSTLSIATVELPVTTKNEIRIGTLSDTLPASSWKKFVDSQALLTPQLLSKDKRTAMMLIETDVVSSTGQGELSRRLEDTLAKTSWKTSVAGVPAVQTRLSEKLQLEVGKFLSLSMLIFCLMFLVFYRNFSPLVFAAIGLVVTNITALGLFSFFGFEFTVLLSTLPIIVSLSFASLAIHSLHLWADRLTERSLHSVSLTEKYRAAVGVLRELFLANFLGGLTTAIGFLALASAPIPAIRMYAFLIAGCVLWAFVVSQVLLFFALPWMRPVQRQWTREKAWWMIGGLRFSAKTFVMVVGLTVFLGGAVIKLNFSSRLFDDLPANEPVRQAADLIDRDLGGTVGLDLVLDAGHSEAWKDPSALRQMRKALAEIRGIEGVGTALGMTDFMGQRTPASRAEVAELGFMFSMAASNPLQQYLDADSRKARVAVRLKDVSSRKVDRIRGEAKAILAKRFPKAAIQESGLAVNSHTINREVAQGLVYGFWHSLAIIGFLLMFVFRSVRWALIACLPNLIPPAVLIGTLAFMQTPVKPAIALVFSIALGLAFNNTVYLMVRIRRLQKEKNLGFFPVKRALLEEGNPCLSESLLTGAGFLIFLTSDFDLNRTFGGYMTLSILAGALADLFFLPAILHLFPEILGRPRKELKLSNAVPESFIEEEEMPLQPETPVQEKSALVASLILGFVVLISGTPTPAHGNEAEALLKQARKSMEARDDQAVVTLKIIEKNGEVKTRQLQLKTLREDGGFKAIAKIRAPADIKGTAVLAEMKNGEENQWLYLPSSRQVRRVVSSKKSGGLLGSELNPEDLNSEAIRGSSVKLVKKDAKFAIVEVTPKKGESAYSRVLVQLALPQALPMRTEYHAGGKARKTVEFKDYAVMGKVHRPRRIIVRNLANQRGTEVEFSEMKVNSKLKSSDFTVNALKK